MLFLFCQKYKSEFYSFLPYKYGAYSFQANHDLYNLEKKHFWLRRNGNDYALTSYPNRAEISIKEEHKKEIESIKTTWRNKKDQEVIRYTYQTYPYYAIFSNLLDNKNISALKPSILRHKPSKGKGKAIFTIGYEGRSVEEYMNILIRNDISALCDVRANPASRKYGFSRKTLQHICGELGIAYQHLPELGIPSNLRKNLHGPDDYEQLFRRYRAKVLNHTASLDQIKKIINEYGRVALTCFEEDIHCCHRKPLAEKLGEVTQEAVEHL